MKKLTKHILKLKKAYPYWHDHLECGLSLSNRILKKIDFFEGELFTLLPDTANKIKLHSFGGGILPSLGKDESGRFVNAWKVQTLHVELSEFIFQFLVKDQEHAAFFEHVIGRPYHQSIKELNNQLISRNDEIYYEMRSGTSKNIILDGITKTNQIWHFLCVLTSGIGKIGSTLTDETIDQIINHLSYIIIGAYDGEGYLFWENLSKNTRS